MSKQELLSTSARLPEPGSALKAAPTIAASYTNSDGIPGRTGIGRLENGTIYRIGLQDGDIGVRSVQSLTWFP